LREPVPDLHGAHGAGGGLCGRGAEKGQLVGDGSPGRGRFCSVVEINNFFEKKWLIDVDDMEFPSPLMMAHIEHNCKPYDPDKIIGVIKTLNGCHLITKPFNIVQFREKYPDVEVKKNSPTLLYYSK
jgi:hypothetical protein